ncbi:MAG: glycosyltransferase family 2 protein, partial [Actinomycetes bacterium]
DSDAYPAPGWLQRAAQLLDEDHRRGAVGGPNVSPPEESRSERLVGRAHRSFLVDGWWTFRKVPGSAARDVDNLPSCNLVVRRSVYESLGGMNEQLFTGEDVDFCTRLINSGWRMRFDPSVLVFHKNRSMRAFVVQRFTFGVAMVPLWRRAESPEPAYNAISIVLALFVLFVASGPLGFVLPTWGRWWRWAMTVYAAVIAAEAVRHAATVDEVPGVAAALTVGNLAPGVGVVAMALGAVPSLKGIYRNDR